MTPTAGTQVVRFIVAMATAVALLGGYVGGVEGPATAQAAPLAADRQVATPADGGAYLARLLDEINRKRVSIGARPLVYVGAQANAAVDRYLADLTPVMQAYNACFHGMHNPVAPGWDYARAAGVDAFPHGEVLACPDPDARWTPEAIAERWWFSPSHAQILYADPDARLVACGMYGQRRGSASYTTVACVTFGD